MINRDQQQADQKRSRLSEVSEVYDSTLKLLHELIAEAEVGNTDAPKKATAQLAVLQEMFVRVRKAEEAFHDKYKEGPENGEIDFDAVRVSLGFRLDRIRNAHRADAVSE
ncbi:hypothetical protein [Marivivens donghaensis]|jgi:hypothetical protein|uniref:hypothetical protein n=1 Tax=Marivivens donghaensis TaxID=1699413 RepID=UPI003F697DFC